MFLTLETSRFLDNVFYWDISLDRYIVQSLVYTAKQTVLIAKFNQVQENLQRFVDTTSSNFCDIELTNKPFSVSFFISGIMPYSSQIETLTIELIPVPEKAPP